MATVLAALLCALSPCHQTPSPAYRTCLLAGVGEGLHAGLDCVHRIHGHMLPDARCRARYHVLQQAGERGGTVQSW